MGDPPTLGVADGLGNFKLLVRTLHTCAHQPCENEGLTFNSRSKLNCQNWVQYRQNFKNYGSNCPIQGGACFNDFSKSIVATGVETFSMYDRAICSLNWKVWSYAGHPRRDSKFEIYSKFYKFFDLHGWPA